MLPSMEIKFWCETKMAIISAGEKHTFRLHAVSEGQPAAKVKLAAAVFSKPEGASVQFPPSIETDNEGVAELPLQAASPSGRFAITVKAGECKWEGTLLVSDVRIPFREGPKLTEEQETLLRMLYWDKQEVEVLRQFGGGLGGCLVIQVQASDSHGRNATQVAKMGPWDGLKVEAESYNLLEPTLGANAAQVLRQAECGVAGAIVYADADAGRALEAVVPLAEFYTKKDSDEIAQALWAVLGVGLPKVYACHRVEPRTFRKLVDRFLPEHLVVSLANGQGECGLYRPGQLPATLPKLRKLTPREVETFKFKFTAEEQLVLAGFRISKMQDGDLNLEDEKQQRYKVKVRYDGAAVPGFSTGDTVDVVARVVTDRSSRLAFAVSDCLGRGGAKVSQYGYELAGENYPDPHALLNSVLDAPCNTAVGTVHGDLHWENVMLESPANWRLIDYGLTGEGAILFDFIKLELYLRHKVLAKDRSITAAQLLAFEQALMENPLGRLADSPPLAHPLAKAADAIRMIRRLARPYTANRLTDYLRFLFCYALALGKYYPTQDKWAGAEKDPVKRKSCDKAGREYFFALAPALVLGRWIQWQRVAAKRPELNLRFVGLGSVLAPQPGAVALDVGNKCMAGVIDHHFTAGEYRCAAEAVRKRPELVSAQTNDTAPAAIEWITHQAPDFDAVSSVWLAWHRVNLGYFPPGSAELVKYACQVDAGCDFLETVTFPERTPYALFMLHVGKEERPDLGPDETLERDRGMVRSGFEVLDYLCGLESLGVHALDSNQVPHEHGFWNAHGNKDRKVFENKDLSMAGEIKVAVRSFGTVSVQKGLILQSPESMFFKAWARRAGFPLLVVRWPKGDKPDHSIVVSVPPSMKGALAGLGAALEKAECKKRKQKKKVRPPPPRWKGVDNNDPWYDGRGHQRTIVQSPREGTVLKVNEVVAILKSGAWCAVTTTGNLRRSKLSSRRPAAKTRTQRS